MVIMGKGISKLDASASPLVRLCKERKKFIKAVKYCRYDFVTAYVIYLDSLLELGNALNQYVERELVIFYDSSSPHLSLSDSDFDPSHEHYSHLEFPSSDSDFESDLDSLIQHLHDNGIEVQDNSEASTAENQDHAAENMHRNHMETRGENTHNHMDLSRETPQSHWFHQNVKQDSFEAPMPFFYYNDRFSHYGAEPSPMDNDAELQKHETRQNSPATASNSPVPPPPPQASTWDFLYPFSSMNYDFHCYDNDHDVRQVREREGIPDLEDETEQSSTVPVVFDEKEMEREMEHGSGNDGTSNVTQINSNEDEALSTEGKELVIWGKTTEKEIECNSKNSESKNLKPKTGENVSSEAEETTTQGNESQGTSSVTTPVASCKMGLKEAILDIGNEFKCVFDNGKEFSSVIEVGKLPHHPISTKLRAIGSRVLGLIFPSPQTSLCPSYMSFKSASIAKLLSNADMQNNQEHVYLSSTLEKLYVWEKKLYAEVMGEEKLRILYDKKYKRLKKLDDTGSEPDKIDDTLASIKFLESEIKVAVSSITSISREISQFRDDKLVPELHKLIEGFIRLWKVMSTCHQKQFQAIKDAKSHAHILVSGKKERLSSKATLRLERVILKWGRCFCNFINTQKAFVKHLNDWLLRCILQEPEETEDGSAPPIFRVCNEWYNAINKISETEVSNAVINFASSLHQLYEKQEEEKALKVRVECHLKDYQYRFQSFCEKNGINSHHYLSFTNMKTSGDIVEAEVPLMSRSDENLATSRKRLLVYRARHEEVFKHVNDSAQSFLQEGLSPIFEALGSFCVENLKIYEQLRVINVGLHE